MGQKKTLELQETTLEFNDFYVISMVRENMIFDEKSLQKIINLCRDHFKGRDFVYISRRIHNYNVNPMVYLKMKRKDSFAGIAIVCDDFSARTTANFEKKFSPLPFDIFTSLEEAIAWAQGLVKE